MLEAHSMIKLSTVGPLRRVSGYVSVSFANMSLQDPLKIRREVMGKRRRGGRKEKEKKPRQREILTSLVYRYSSLHLRLQTDFWWEILLSL